MHRIDEGRWPVIPSQLNAQSQQFTILLLVDYFQPSWFPQDLFPASLPTFLNWKYYEGNFLLAATSNFHITFSGPCSLRIAATSKSISNGVLDGVTWITKNQTAIRNGFCLLTADGFKGCWGPLCFRSTPAATRLQGFGKVCVLDGKDLYDPENIFLTHNWTIKSDTTGNVVKGSKSRKTLRCCKSSDFISASKKRNWSRVSQPCSWRAAHGSKEQAGCCSPKPSAVQHLCCQLMLRNNLFRGSQRGCSILWLHYRSPWPDTLHIHSKMCRKPKE